jgi:hypothetical protein
LLSGIIAPIFAVNGTYITFGRETGPVLLPLGNIGEKIIWKLQEDSELANL